ncbi:MAG TPA: tetratricopeptide repeat protein [Verrucomicrobiota bacterium]|nr:tetratricopeptide repeat protein [Verrucomicrobiota bacterium]HNU50883.1 tetratricopeptide repeat protein [Verrucomicrobiota bacterium]
MSRFGNLEFNGQHAAETRQSETLSDEARCLREADVLFRRGDFEQALRQFARAMECNPSNPACWVGQVRMLVELDEVEEANQWADKALDRFPRDPEVLAAKAVALARRGDSRAALAFSDAAIEEHNQNPYVWLSRGDVLLARAEKRAEYCFAKALGAAAGDWLWAWLAARVHYVHHKFSLALKLATQALALDSSQAVVWYQIGRCQLALGLEAAADESFRQGRELDPQCPEADRVRHHDLPGSTWRRWHERWKTWFRS